ncbi:YdeI/OmpD-associated family protein [Nibricoccus aquaticus]|nr:YdeI/OmpD-associated family protein [Nibricoccus aquaticus]
MAGQKTETVSLRGKLYRIALVRWVDVPKRAVAPLALDASLNAWLIFNGDKDRVTLMRGKRGAYRLAFKVELLRAAGVDEGDEVAFELKADRASREPELPEEMRKVFLARPYLEARWQVHSVAMRRQLVRYIEQAKRSETRAKRCWIFIERLEETGRLTAS